MLVPISEIKVNAGRREADPEGVQELVDSISKVGLLNPITIDREHTLIAGLHRLEAAKLLGWTEIECNVSSLEGLLAELAEVDENVVRKGLSAVEYSDLLLRRKEIYEALHPETKNGGDQKSEKIRTSKCRSDWWRSKCPAPAEGGSGTFHRHLPGGSRLQTWSLVQRGGHFFRDVAKIRIAFCISDFQRRILRL